MPYTLLLADDSVTIQRVIELTFADEDVVVVAVSDGDQAIERLEASPPDIVLADIGMPGKNGYEVAQYIRQSPRLSHIPVVLLTGAFEPVDQARAAEAGCDGVLAKPFEPQLVIGRVKELLARTHRVPASLDGSLAAVPPPPPADQWMPPIIDPPFGTPATDPAAGPSGLNDYFDRLDAAFSSLPSNVPPPAPLPSATAPVAPPLGDTEIDWFGTTASGAPSTKPWDLPAPAADRPDDLPLTYVPPPPPAAPLPSFEQTQPAPPAPFGFDAADQRVASNATPSTPWEPAESATPVPAAAQPAPAAAPGKLPALADAFAALLAVEQGEPAPADAPSWPATLPAAPAVTDELVEETTRRVLDRLSDHVVPDKVAEIISEIAERLIKEEIERIKASIK